MFDSIPIQVWLLILIGLFGYQQAVYVYQYLASSPSRRDITQPSEDLSWRTSTQFTKSALILMGLVALGGFIFTPAAVKLVQWRGFWPSIVSAMASLFVYFTIEGLAKGKVEPLIKGDWGLYDRREQPGKYWVSSAWNVAISAIFVWMAFNMWTNPEWLW